MMPRISIIVPVYNVEHVLKRCCESILCQTYADFECILVDDGSTDQSGTICDKYAGLDERFKVIHQSNGGVSAARNTGLDHAIGDFIAFVDSDDCIHPEYLNVLLSSLICVDADASICDYIVFKDSVPDIKVDKVKKTILSGEDICYKLYDYGNSERYVIPGGKLWKRKCYANLRFPVGKIHEDQSITYKAFFDCNRVVTVDVSLYFYWVNPNGITKKGFSLQRYDNIEALTEARALYLNNDKNDLAAKTDSMRELFIAMYSIYAREYHIYADVDTQYKMSRMKAGRIIKNQLGYDSWEWHMNKCFPTYIKLHSYFKKICSFFGK